DVLARVFSRLTFERHTSDTVAGPLSAAARSHVGCEAHNGGSIAWRTDASPALSRLGTLSPFSQHGSRRPAVRVGPRLDSGERPPSSGRAGGSAPRVGDGGDGGYRRVLHAGADRRLSSRGVRRRHAPSHISERVPDAARVQ